MRNMITLIITLLLAVMSLLAGCNVITGEGEPVSLSTSPAVFHSDRYDIEVTLPSGWAAVEGPETISIKSIKGIVSFNSWGRTDFWARAIVTDNPDGSKSSQYGPAEVTSQIKDGGAYVALEEISGPPYAQGSQPTEYTLDDLSGLYQPHDWRQDSANWAYFKTFYRNDSDLTLVVACHKNASDETVDQLNELLTSWRFTATETPTTTITETEISINPPLQLNTFITPEIMHEEKTVTIWANTDWEINYDADWLNVIPKSGGSWQFTEVTIKIVDTDLTPGEYKTTIFVNSKTSTSQKLLPVVLNVITEMPDQILNIPVEIKLNDISLRATDFSNPMVKVGALEESAFNPYAGGEYVAGDPWIIVSGEFSNKTDNDTYMLITVEGYDADGVQKSWSLSSGPRVGTEDYDIPANSSISVELLLSWANELSSIKIIASIMDSMFP